MKSTTLGIFAKVLQKIILAGYYLIAVIALYFVFKVAIFVLMFAVKECIGYEIISRIWLKAIAFFLANTLLIYKIIESYRIAEENSEFENMRKQIVYNVHNEEVYIDRENLISINNKIKIE